MNYQREMAIVFVGIGAILCIWRGETEAGAGLLGALVGFIMGERNGIKKSVESE